MFCRYHPIPHEDCDGCLATVSAMRPTVFAELAAAELRAGTQSCAACDYVYVEAVACCPRCGTGSLLQAPGASRGAWAARALDADTSAAAHTAAR